MKKRKNIHIFRSNPAKKPISFPKNRFEVFFDLFFHRFGTLLLISLLTSVFFLPLFVLHSYAFSLTMIDSSTEEAVRYIYNVRFWEYILNIPAIMIASLGVAASVHVIRKLAHAEMVFIGHDFKDGMRRNWHIGLWNGFVLGISSALLLYGLEYAKADSFFLTAIINGASVLQFVIVSIASLYNYAGCDTYDLSLGKLILNSLLFLVKELPINIAYLLLMVAPLSVCFFFSNLYVWLIGFLIVALIGISYSLLIMTLFVDYSFDKHINKTNYPEIVDKGVWRKGN